MQTIHEKFPWIKKLSEKLRAEREAEEHNLFLESIKDFKPQHAFSRLYEMREVWQKPKMRKALEQIILQCPYWSYCYAVDILGSRWLAAELNIWRTTQEPWRTEYRQKFVAILDPLKEAGTWEAYCKNFGLDPSKQPSSFDIFSS